MQTDRSTKNRQGAGSAKSSAYYNPGLTPDAASRPAAYGLATSVSTQLWAWPSNLCIEPLQKLFYQI